MKAALDKRIGTPVTDEIIHNGAEVTISAEGDPEVVEAIQKAAESGDFERFVQDRVQAERDKPERLAKVADLRKQADAVSDRSLRNHYLAEARKLEEEKE